MLPLLAVHWLIARSLHGILRMNIDFHYGVTYVVARLAGMNPTDAQIVAHASQYVDNATTSGILKFSGGETYERFASASQITVNA
ncbi:MAG: hypothetical protein H7Z39_07435 [Burkholderiaceae bacterium]|nr:hypothetical protein [Burkholderiaceae bacterium]